MFNFIPKRCPSVSLLYGKRPIQRITAGKLKKQIELPISVVDRIYEKVDKNVNLHNNDFNPMKWTDFVDLKLDAYYLIEAGLSDQSSKSSLNDLDWYPTLHALYAGQQTLTEMNAALQMAKPKFKYPIQGVNI